MSISSASLFKVMKITQDGIIKGSPGKIWAVQFTGAEATCLLEFYNDVDSANGDLIVTVAAPFTAATSSSNSSVFFDYTPLGGITFDTGCYVDLTGAGSVGFVWIS